MKQPLLLQARYRNNLERRVADQLDAAGVSFEYEPSPIPYEVPARKAKYTLDFRPRKTPKIILESKGYFGRNTRDRTKYLLIRDSNPDLDLRFIFYDAKKKIYKGSKTTYGQWATDNGFKWSDKGVVPQKWLDEMKGLK